MSESPATSLEACTPPAKLRRRWVRRLLLTILVLFAGVNAIAFLHARAMTHMVPTGEKTASPQALSVWGKIRVLCTGVTVPRPVNRRRPDVPYTTHQFTNEDGQLLEAWLIRSDESRGLVIMFHGYSVSKSTLLSPSKAIRAAGYDTLLVDFRGSGGSSGNITTIGHDEALDVATAVLGVRSANLDNGKPILAYGDSMGAAAIMYAIRSQGVKFDALVLEQPYATLYRTTSNRFASMGVPSFPLAGLLLFWGGVQNGFWPFDLRPVEFATDIRCPTLLIRGQGDPWISMEESQSIYDAMTCPKQLLTIQTNRHDSLRARDAARWDATVQEFLRGLK